MSSAQMPTAAFPQLGRYQIVRKLGEGGMGAVYLAQDMHLSRQVAVKILPPHSVNNPDAIARFQREARALAQLSHPNIIQAYDTGAENGQHFLVMEYIEGKSFAALLAEQTRLPPLHAAGYIHQAALALEHAHEKGLIHRDVKPSNLLVTNDGQVKLLDLSLARFLQDQLGDAGQTREGVGMGTPDYAPPEQFRDAHNVDHRADIYSLGCTLYHLLTGRVPFPTSSLSEKYTAHATKEPTPLTELGIDAPGGLVLALEKMMAKSPADRFQSAREVADVLVPHVSASSSSFAKFKDTASWQMGQLTMPEFPRRRRWLPWAVAVFTSVASLVLLILLLTYALRPGTQQVAESNTDDSKKSEPTKPEPTKSEPEKKPVVEREPNILTVSKLEKDGGFYRTINEALDNVAAGQTIRVLDDGPYQENLVITRLSTQRGIRIESTRQAKLELKQGNVLVRISVPDVTLCNFKLCVHESLKPAPGKIPTLIVVEGNLSGGVLERLTLEVPAEVTVAGIEVYGLEIPPSFRSKPDLTIRNVVFRRLNTAITLFGCNSNYQPLIPVEAVVIRDNFFENGFLGVNMMGNTRRVAVVGNQFIGMNGVAVQLEHLLDAADSILVANNTMRDCRSALRGWDEKIGGKRIRLQNNLVLQPNSYDFQVVQSTTQAGPAQPGDGVKAAALWQFGYNWRETGQPTGTDRFNKAWIPPTDKDVMREKIAGYESDRKSAHFLRPDKDSDLATKGAGNEEPSLPRYVGAIPPEGVEPWDWERTWLAWPGTTKLLTVSKLEKDGGKYRTIGDALGEAKTWDTIRVLDDETYEETIALTDPEKQTGLCFEAPRKATLHLSATDARAVFIRDVPHVRINGFRFDDIGGSSRNSNRVYVLVAGKSSGVVLHGLELKATLPLIAVLIQGVDASAVDYPVRVERCLIQSSAESPNDGILVISQGEVGPSQGILIRDNLVVATLRGVALQGRVDRVSVVGNVIVNCQGQAGIDFSNVSSPTRQVFVANNTVCGCYTGLRFSELRTDGKYESGGIIANNLILDATGADIAYLTAAGPNPKPGDGTTMRSAWRWLQNSRDGSGNATSFVLPMDRKLDLPFKRDDLTKFDVLKAEYPHPVKDSELAIGGGGTTMASLPLYIGALPPAGINAWNWDWTWHAQTSRVAAKEKAP